MFRIQVYTPDVDPQTVEDALHITYGQSKKVSTFICAPALSLSMISTSSFKTLG
jgi:hypothetical protein